MAEDPVRPPPDSRHTRTTSAGAADLPTGAAQVVSTVPPGLPPGMPTGPAQVVSTMPPGMPTGPAQVVATMPPGMPTGPAQVISTMPPGMPTGPAQVISTVPPAMPTMAAPIGGIATSLPPAMPTFAGSSSPRHVPSGLSPARYELGAEIARGGMGRVVDANDTTLGRVVAFKEALSTDSDALRRFQREIMITARLEHPSIVPVHDAGESGNGAPFYVMRKVSGRPLEKLVASAETLGQRLALIPHIVDSAQAIAHAHERGIVHRDIKPSNILVGDLGETVVIDWGLAKVIGEPDDPHHGKPLVDLSDSLKTRAGIVYGTPGFMAPEQLRGAPVNEQADVYALGATLYHLLSRTPPHHAKTADEMMKAAVAAPPTPIHQLVDGVPPDLATIVDKALAHDPKLRYQDARALAQDLQSFLTGRLVAAHHYTPREKLVRFIKKNRGLSAAVAALLVVGSFAIIRIVIERNRADAAAHDAIDAQAKAETERATAVRYAEQLMLSDARYKADLNPTQAVASLKPLATKRWRDVRAIAAAARASGVAWSVPTSRQTRSLELSHDGKRALSAGGDGVIRIHDLVQRTSQPIADLRTPVMARFADEERRVVTWHDTQVAIIDTRTAARRELTVARPIIDLEVIGITAYFVDDHHSLWQLDLAGTTPTEIALDEPVRALAPSPDGRWIGLSGESHLYLYDRTQPSHPATEITMGDTHDLAWSADGKNFAALIDQFVIDVTLDPELEIVHRQTVGVRQFIAHDGARMYTVGPTGVAVLSRTERGLDGSQRKQLPGNPVGLSEARGSTMIAGATGGLTVMSPDGDRILPLQGERVERVLASPRSPYVVAQLQGRLLVWNLDDIQPRKLTTQPTGRALFATADLVITGGSPDQPMAQAIDVATGQAHPLGAWPGLRTVAASRTGNHVAIVDGQRHLHLVTAGKDPEDVPGEVDFVGFATDDQLIVATLDGAIWVHDLERQRRAPLVPRRARLLGVAWGRGHHPWVAAAFVDGTLWRKNLTTGETATIARAPKLDLDHLADRDGKLLVDADGTVTFLHDKEIHAWGSDGRLVRLAAAPKRLDDFGEAGPDAVVAFSGDGSVFEVPRKPPYTLDDASPSLDGTSAAMAPDTGMVVVLEHGDLDVLDPLVHQRWTLAHPTGVTFANPAVSSDGRRVLAQTEKGLVVWTIELPAGADATVKWLNALTNAVDDRSPGGIGWR